MTLLIISLIIIWVVSGYLQLQARDMANRAMDTSEEVLNPSEITSYVHACIKAGDLAQTTGVVFDDIFRNQVTSGIAMKSSGELFPKIVFPMVGADFRFVKHEIGHCVDFSERLSRGKVQSRLEKMGALGKKVWVALGLEYLEERRAWIISGIDAGDEMVKMAMKTYRYRWAESAVMIALFVTLIANITTRAMS